jgi:GT2 family glycosyltransferase
MISPHSVTVIVTPRERYSVARRTFESVAANTPGDQRVVYVAGGAPPEFQRFLRDGCERPNYELILTPGFLAPNVARNLGLARVETKYVAFLDNDVVVEPGWLDALVRCAEEEDADIVSPLCLTGEPSELKLHSYGGKLMIESRDGQLRLRERHHFGQISLRGSSKRLTRVPTDYSEFHCSLVRRSVFERMGPLDEKIIGGAEHVDLALHMRELGCHGFTEPAAVVSHLAIGYTVRDLDCYTQRWNTEWYVPSMAHLAEKWRFAPNTDLIGDYLSDFLEKRERCLLRLDTLRSVPPAAIQNLVVAQTIVQLLDQMAALGYEPASLSKVRDAHMIAARLFAASFRASGRPLLAHLSGIASILAAYGANPTLVAAAMLSAAYTKGEFPEGFNQDVAAMRRWLRRRVGGPVETLVFTYSHLRPESVTRFLPHNLEDMPLGLANTTIMKMADEIENCVAGDHRYFDSSAWLRDSGESVVRWMPIFTAVADRIGFGDMPKLLREVSAKTPPSAADAPLEPAPPLDLALESKSGVMRPLHSRHIAEPDGRESAVDFSGHRLEIGLDAIAAINGGNAARESGWVRVDAASRPWTYSAEVRLPDLLDQSGPALLEVRLQVERGEMGALILERGNSVFTVGLEQSVAMGTDPSTLRFEIPAMEEVGHLVFRGWPHDDGAAKARILGISFLSDRPSTALGRGFRDRLAALATRLRPPN